MKKILLIIVSFFLFITISNADEIDIKAKSAILIEESTGKVIYEKNSSEQLNPASMTKIMSMILIFEALEENKINLNDDVIISKTASSMGGSQVYVNEGEVYKVEELLNSVKEDEKVGVKIILKSLEEPVKQIARNAGLEPEVILENVKKASTGFGFDADKEQYVDMKKAGIVDPTKVTRSALQNAASIAAMVLTTESLVTEVPESKGCGCGNSHRMDAEMGGMY